MPTSDLMSAPEIFRRPAVAGYYYPSDAQALKTTVDALVRREYHLMRATALVLPHGSYAHAGGVIGATLSRLEVPRRCIIIGPSHTGSWIPWSLMLRGAYRTPLGDVVIDAGCAEALHQRCAFLTPDAWTQHGEHAIEVLLPFLQRLAPPDLTIVPIITGSDDPDECLQLARAIAQVVRMQEEPVLLIASSDLSHYEPEVRGAVQDHLLLEMITTLKSEALIQYVQQRGVLMCGYAAAACVIDAARLLGATHGTVAAYDTSVAAGGDPNSVIGYAGVVLT